MFTYSNCCRLCLANDEHMIDYKFIKNGTVSYYQKINKIMPTLLLDSSNILPTIICRKCEDNIDTSYNFIEKCIKTNKLLKEYVINVHSVNNKKPIQTIDNNDDDDNEPIIVNDTKIKEEEYSDNDIEEIEMSCSFLNNSIIDVDNLTENPLKSTPQFEEVFVKTESDDISNNMVIHGIQPYCCKTCNKRFSTLAILQIHESVHIRDKQYPCSMCYKKFAQLGNLRKHERSHTGEKPYACRICKKTFTNASDLRRHERVHTDEKPFICKTCNRAFKNSSHLRTHERIHSGENPFVCKVCEKAFKNSSNLRKHELIHSGDKPFICKICSRAFRQLSHVLTHERTHTTSSSNVPIYSS